MHEGNKATERQWTGRQKALVFGLGGIGFALMAISLGSDIPKGENGHKARIFLQEGFPKQARALEGSTAPVAVVFHLIRSAEPEVARQAVDFATRHRLGYAAPYVIGRLGGADLALEVAAQGYLREIAGHDYGPAPESWRAWWRNPPRNLFGVVVKEQTFAFAVPIVTGLSGLLLLTFGRARNLDAASFLGGVLLVLFWFMAFALSMVRLVGKYNICTFDSSPIVYYSNHGDVVGLEDSRVGGGWLVFVLLAAFVLVPILLLVAYARIERWWRSTVR